MPSETGKKGKSNCHIYSSEGREKHAAVEMNLDNEVLYKNERTGGTMRLPAGVIAGRYWKKVKTKVVDIPMKNVPASPCR